MRFTIDQLAEAAAGEVEPADSAVVTVDGLGIDSRDDLADRCFVPLVAERDGHLFIGDAVGSGAVATLAACDRSAQVPDGVAVIRVDDTAEALTSIGRSARGRVNGPVVGITGSVGKTSAKDLLGPVLARDWSTWWSPRSHNNEIGVPLTLANAPDGCEAVVVEMGARGIGHIGHLCEVARPTVGVVTVVAGAHLELFGSLDDVQQAKGELVESLPDSGLAVLNAGDPRVMAMAGRTGAAVLTYGGDGEVRAERVVLDEQLRPSFRLASPWGHTEVRLQVRGRHQIDNALAAAAAGMWLGVRPEDVAAALGEAGLSPWRMDLRVTGDGVRVLDDSYNANPTSTEAALRALVELPATRRLAVLGVMAELGPEGPDEHLRIAGLAHELGVQVVAVGTPDYGVDPVDGPDEALASLGPLGSGVAILVKGSRVAGLERLVARLCEEG